MEQRAEEKATVARLLVLLAIILVSVATCHAIFSIPSEQSIPGKGAPMSPNPVYQHDCTLCRFMQNLTVEGIVYDVYRCPKTAIGESTWLARYGDEGSEYWSMPWDVMKGIDVNVATPLTVEMLRIAREHENG